MLTFARLQDLPTTTDTSQTVQRTCPPSILSRHYETQHANRSTKVRFPLKFIHNAHRSHRRPARRYRRYELTYIQFPSHILNQYRRWYWWSRSGHSSTQERRTVHALRRGKAILSGRVGSASHRTCVPTSSHLVDLILVPA